MDLSLIAGFIICLGVLAIERRLAKIESQLDMWLRYIAQREERERELQPGPADVSAPSTTV
jgi:hypothetical protein